MIKCSYFGKLLKQLFFTLLISCFILLGNSSVNAGTVQTVGLNPSNSIYDGNYKLTFLKGGGVLTNFFGQSKSVLSFVQSGLFRWYVDGKPYFYDNGFQGYFGEYRICDELTGDDSVPTNCVSYPITGDFKSTFKGFFSSVSAGDYAYYDYEPMDIGSSYFDNTVQVCRSSNSYNASLCFRQHSCYNGRGCSAGNYGSLVGSKGLTLSFDTIQQARIGYAPGQVGYDGNYDSSEGSISVNLDNTLTGDYSYVGCTYGEIISELESAGFNKYMCYGGINNFSDYDSSLSYNPTPGTGLRLSQILNHALSGGTWSSPQDWYNFWDGLYSDRYNNNYNAMWESYPAVYRTWFDLYYQYGRKYNKNFDYVREYCVLTVDLNVNPNNKYNGTYFKGVCDTVNDKRINSGYYIGSGDTVVGTNWNGVGNLSGVVVSNDPLKFIQDYFNLSKQNIPTRYDFGLGILPVYIITFMCAIILFRFLSH